MADDQAGNTEVNKDIEGAEGTGDGSQDKIVIGEDALSPDEAKELIEAGKTMKELKEQYPDVDFKAMPAEFTKRSQELAELKKPKEEPDNDPDAKAIDDFFDNPRVQKRLDERLKVKDDKLKEDLQFRETIKALEDEFDGSDGRPKFDREKVVQYGLEKEIFNLRTAYNDLHAAELDEWKINKALEKKRPSTYFERRGSGGATPPDVKLPRTFEEAEAAVANNE
jgi:hypothetical protein